MYLTATAVTGGGSNIRVDVDTGCDDAEVEDENKDNYDYKDDYNYQDNSTIDNLWYKLQCDDVFASGLSLDGIYLI